MLTLDFLKSYLLEVTTSLQHYHSLNQCQYQLCIKSCDHLVSSTYYMALPSQPLSHQRDGGDGAGLSDPWWGKSSNISGPTHQLRRSSSHPEQTPSIMAGKKSGGENTKKVAGNARKADVAAQKQAAQDSKKAEADEEEWSKGAKSNAKKYVRISPQRPSPFSSSS